MGDLRRWSLATLIVVGLVMYVVGPDRIAAWLDRDPVVPAASASATAPDRPSATPVPTGGDRVGTGDSAGGADAPAPPADAGRAVVLAVSDGDTVHLEIRSGPDGRTGVDVRARLLRIDAPELARDGQPEECGAAAARDRLAQLLPPGSEVAVAWDVEPTDQYGRDLVHLWSDDGTWVNGALVAEGRAREVLFRPNDGYDAEVRAMEAAARRAGRGMWSC